MQEKRYKAKISDYEAWKIIQKAVLNKLNCHNIGRIIEFDPDTQLCTVELMHIIEYREQQITPVPITEVPLIIYGAGNGHITLPDPSGSICLLLFLDRNIEKFKQTGEQYTPGTTRTHDFTDCVALTTFKTLANPLENYDERAVSIFNKELIEEISYNSYVKVYGNQVLINSTQNGEDEANTNISIAPNAVEISTQNYSLDSDTALIKSSLGGEVSINALINIKNNSQNLAVLIQSFIAACENIVTVNGDVLSQASKETFTSLKTQFQELLI